MMRTSYCIKFNDSKKSKNGISLQQWMNVSQKDIGFNSDYNKISVIDKTGSIKIIPKSKKSFIAKKIVEILLDKLLINDRNIN